QGVTLLEVALGEAEVVDDDRADEELEDGDELDLRDEVRLAGLVDELRDLAHRLVDGRALELLVDDAREHHPEHGDEDARHEELRSGHAAEEARDLGIVEVRDDEAG